MMSNARYQGHKQIEQLSCATVAASLHKILPAHDDYKSSLVSSSKRMPLQEVDDVKASPKVNSQHATSIAANKNSRQVCAAWCLINNQSHAPSPHDSGK